MSRCVFCESSVSRKQGVFCFGPCKNLYHIECAKIPGELVSYLNSVAGLQWKCPQCRIDDPKYESKKHMEIFEKRCNEILNEISCKFDSLKNEFLTSTALDNSGNRPTISASQHLHQPSYAEVSRRMQKIVVKPKDPKQTNSETKSDLRHVLNPASMDVPIGNVKHARDGGIILGSNHSEGIIKLKATVEKELSSRYEVHLLKTAHHQVRVVGVSESYNNDTIKQLLIKQNSDIFSSISDINVIKFWPTKRNSSVYQALLQLDSETFNRITSAKRVLVGFDSCSVYEAFDFPRCFNCCSFFHTKKSCKNNTKCPVCSGEHEVKMCTVKDKFQCINCVNLKEALKLDINTSHAAWDYEKCFAYKKALGKFKTDLLGTPSK